MPIHGNAGTHGAPVAGPAGAETRPGSVTAGKSRAQGWRGQTRRGGAALLRKPVRRHPVRDLPDLLLCGVINNVRVFVANVWEFWAEWSVCFGKCNLTSAEGTRVRRRLCTTGSCQNLEGPQEETRHCNFAADARQCYGGTKNSPQSGQLTTKIGSKPIWDERSGQIPFRCRFSMPIGIHADILFSGKGGRGQENKPRGAARGAGRGRNFRRPSFVRGVPYYIRGQFFRGPSALFFLGGPLAPNFFGRGEGSGVSPGRAFFIPCPPPTPTVCHLGIECRSCELRTYLFLRLAIFSFPSASATDSLEREEYAALQNRGGMANACRIRD